MALGQRVQFLRQIGKQQRAEGGFGSDQLTHRGAVQPPQLAVVGRHETVAGLAGDHGPAVETIVRAVAGDPFIAVPPLHVALNQHEQMRRRIARRQQHLAGGHRTVLQVPAHQRLLLAGHAVEGRMGKVMGEVMGVVVGEVMSEVERLQHAGDLTTRT